VALPRDAAALLVVGRRDANKSWPEEGCKLRSAQEAPILFISAEALTFFRLYFYLLNFLRFYLAEGKRVCNISQQSKFKPASEI